MIRPNRDSLGGSASLPLLTKWNQAASSATSTVSAEKPGGEAEVPLRECI